MKTAISVPNDVFESADELADELGVSRSALYSTAMAEYLAKHRGADPPMDGYRIRKADYYLSDPGLEADELAALHLAGNAVRIDGLSGASFSAAVKWITTGRRRRCGRPV